MTQKRALKPLALSSTMDKSASKKMGKNTAKAGRRGTSKNVSKNTAGKNAGAQARTKPPLIRINQGLLKGLGLGLPARSTTRPSKAIVREALINSLAYELALGALFIEGFSGSGSMGIAALSAGARASIFIERDEASYEVLCHNLKRAASFNKAVPLSIGTLAGASLANITALKGSAIDLLPGLLAHFLKERDASQNTSMPTKQNTIATKESPLDTGHRGCLILYLDAPFHTNEGYEEIYMMLFTLIKRADIALDMSGVFVVFEHASSFHMPKTLGSIALYRQKRFGKSTLSYYKKEA